MSGCRVAWAKMKMIIDRSGRDVFAGHEYQGELLLLLFVPSVQFHSLRLCTHCESPAWKEERAECCDRDDERSERTEGAERPD